MILKQIWMTSHRVVKAMILLVVSTFLFAQFASAKHDHSHSHSDSDVGACSICIISAESDIETDVPVPEDVVTPVIFNVPITLKIPISVSAPFFTRDDVKTPPPPDIRPSAPRAPPV